MRKKFIAGNWKMNLNGLQASDLAAAIATSVASAKDVEVAVFPPAVYLEAVIGALHGSAVGVGAQNCHYEAKGAFTGEIAPAMLVDIGCKYVILGHSERRQFFHETSADVNKKTLAALAAGLTPIVCVGESLSERQAGNTSKVVREQMEGSLAGISADQLLKLVIAYEPIWAIGTGVVATPEQAEEVHADLRSLLSSRYTAPIAEQVRIQYGGSVNAENAATLLSQPNIDGALVGGASLKADGFLAIIQGARK
jgi:triosephosphate isomerase